MKQIESHTSTFSSKKTENDAFLTLAALCAQAEHCQWEMLEKMRRWKLPEEEQARIMQRLIDGRYVDDERFARAFVKDKVRYNKWGRRKVEQALWQKHIAEDIRQRTLDEIEEEDYLDVLRPLLKQKRKTIKASSDYEMNQKLARFAMSRGFTYDIISQCIHIDDELVEEDS
jgi:regulatory protein